MKWTWSNESYWLIHTNTIDFYLLDDYASQYYYPMWVAFIMLYYKQQEK